MSQVIQSHLIRATCLILPLIIASAFGLMNEKSFKDPSCTAACSCCLDTIPCTSSNDGCSGQCIDRIFGMKCKTLCPTNCIRCTEHPDISATDSTYWDVGYCTECKDGYYSTSEFFQCQFECPAACQTCNSDTECTSCKDGNTLEGTTCRRCEAGCAHCSSYNVCTLCLDLYYSSSTECVACSNGCSNHCDKGTGACNCKYGFDDERCDRCMIHFSGTNCDKCSPGYHGTSCNQTCPDHCKHNECDRHNGTCTQGCTGNFDGATCNDCVVGWYGHDCSLRCPGNCDGFCNRSSGYCQRCKADFAGNTCDECSAGKHGSDCGLACSPGCEDKMCDRGTGTCDNCKDGRYGELCNRPCSPNCLQRACQQKTGACIGECMSGYSGDMCCLKGSNCNSCASSVQCVECLPGKYDETCNSQCPANCVDNICYKNNGTCNKCTDGFQGHYCTLAIYSSDGTPGAAIGGGVAGGLLVIIVVVVLIIVYSRRRARMCDGPRGSNGQAADVAGTHSYVNEMRVTSNETQYNRKAVQGKTRELQEHQKQQRKYQTQQQKHQQHILKYQQKEAKSAEQAARIELELDEMKGKHTHNQDSEDGANPGTVNSTYETLDPQEYGDNPYDELSTK